MYSSIPKPEYGSTVDSYNESIDNEYYSLISSKELEISSNESQNKRNSDNNISTIKYLIFGLILIIVSIISYTKVNVSNIHLLSFSQGHMTVGGKAPIASTDKTLPAKPTKPTIPATPPGKVTVEEDQVEVQTTIKTSHPIDTTDFQFGLIRDGYSYVNTKDTQFTYVFLSSYDAVVEPYALNYMWVSSSDGSIYYKYKLTSKSDSSKYYEGITYVNDDQKSTGITVPCDPFDEFVLSYEAYSVSSNELLSSDSNFALCMYVRREIRTLTAEDLSDTMDAMYELWVHNDDEGKAKYGENFLSSTYMTNFHHFNAAWQDSDHVHEGNGFLVQHLKLTNMIEKSMQAVNPAVTLPYWDFTIDSEKGRGAFNSFIMTEEVFGSMKVPSDITKGFTYKDDKIIDGAIQNGRWAFLKADSSPRYKELTTGYGFSRAPWNMNPSPYVSRFTSDYRVGINLPGCSSHYSIIQAGDMMDFFYNMQFDPHATTHALIGGIYGCDLLEPFLESGSIPDDTNLKNICSKWVFYLKEFYRYNFIAPKTVEECSIESLENDNGGASCGFKCVVDPDSKAFHNNIYAKLSKHLSSDQSADTMDEWIDFICNGDGYKIFAGDHLESASPADPSFWVIHPTLERLLHAKLMSGGFKVEKWATSFVHDFVCEKSHCYEADVGYTDTHADCCYGHYENDQLLDAISGDRTNRIGLTNKQMLESSDPRTTSYVMPYIYDSFSWDHCTSTSFSSLFKEMRMKSGKENIVNLDKIDI